MRDALLSVVPAVVPRTWAVDHLVPGHKERITLFKTLCILCSDFQVFYLEKLPHWPVHHSCAWLPGIARKVGKLTLAKIDMRVIVRSACLRLGGPLQYTISIFQPIFSGCTFFCSKPQVVSCRCTCLVCCIAHNISFLSLITLYHFIIIWA